jgi:Amt family ammonium transporter
MVSTGAYILSAGSNARELLQIPLIPGDVVDVPQDQLPQDQLSEGVELLSTLDSGDTAWMLTSTILVLMMTIPGLALFYGGLVRPKNVLNAASNVFATVALVTLVWVLWGYSIAFSDVEMEKGRYNLHSFFGSLHNGGLTGISLFSSTGNYPASIFVTFHCMFACITTAIISGAFAERLRLTAVWAFAILWSTAVYCPLAHQVWGGDGAFLHSLGAIDFAGGIVVHVSSGASGLTVASMIGKRAGYPNVPKAPHSLVLTNIGASLLWVGWFGFNAGSSTAADFIAGQAMLVTQIASAAGVVGWTAVEMSCYGGRLRWGWCPEPSPDSSGSPRVGFDRRDGRHLHRRRRRARRASPFCTYVKESIGTYDDSLDVFGIHGVGGALFLFFFSTAAHGSLSDLLFFIRHRRRSLDRGVVRAGARRRRVRRDRPARRRGPPDPRDRYPARCSGVLNRLRRRWSVFATVLIVKFIDVCHGGWHPRLCALTHCRSTPKEEEAGLDDAYFAESGYNFQPQDMAISVEVGPLRGRKGHGLQLYYTDEEGTRHPIGFGGEHQDPNSPSQMDALERMNEAARPHALSDAVANALWSDG